MQAPLGSKLSCQIRDIHFWGPLTTCQLDYNGHTLYSSNIANPSVGMRVNCEFAYGKGHILQGLASPQTTPRTALRRCTIWTALVKSAISSSQGKSVGPEQIIGRLLHRLTPERRQKLLHVVGNRSRHCIGIMENIYDQGNVHAIIRSSESFGFFQLGRVASAQQKSSSRTTSGAHKWILLTDFFHIEQAIQYYRSQGYQIGATSLSPSAIPISQVDFSRPTALIFGNETRGA